MIPIHARSLRRKHMAQSCEVGRSPRTAVWGWVAHLLPRMRSTP